MNKKVLEIQRLILNWYDKEKRPLPWRDNPTPYNVLISEIMLQQTRVETVIPFFNRFIQKLPNIESLSKVDDDVLYKLWQGLGYYRRATNLKKAAILIMSEFAGQIPNHFEDLKSLPGIGDYTCGAILSIAFNQKYPAIDGNVLRVFSRYFGVKESLKNIIIKKNLINKITDLLPNERNGDFTQALMEIGATRCIPNGLLKCMTCPLNNNCFAYCNNMQNMIPLKEEKKARKKENITVFVITFEKDILIQKRPEKGLLSSLWELPNILEHLSILDARTWLTKKGFMFDKVKKLQENKHIFTHIEWDMIGYVVTLSQKQELESLVWANTNELTKYYSIPSAFLPYVLKLK